jgi:hypothetical protein
MDGVYLCIYVILIDPPPTLLLPIFICFIFISLFSGSPPSKPQAPMVTSISGQTITVASKSIHDNVDNGNMYNGGEPITSWDFQITLIGTEIGSGNSIYGAEDASYKYHTRRTKDTVGGHRWINLAPLISRNGLTRPLQQNPRNGASITASNLPPMTTYVFRTRANNIHGSSAWSEPSTSIKTLAGRPTPPTQPMIKIESTTDASITIAWSYNYDDNVATGKNYQPPTSNGAVIEKFEIEKLELTNVHYSEWEPSGVIYFSTNEKTSTFRNEIQTVSTRSDFGYDISDGWFMLGFNHDGRTAADPESGVVTTRIPYDATAKQVKDALEKLPNIGMNGLIRVDRNVGLSSSEMFETNSKDEILQAGVGVADALGNSYRWTVVFDSTKDHLKGDLPMLFLVGEGISAPWTGGGLQVNVVETVKGGRKDAAKTFNENGVNDAEGLPKTDPAVRQGNLGTRDIGEGFQAVEGMEGVAAAATIPLIFTAHNLKQYTNYRFRVRAIGGDGKGSENTFSDWSTPSSIMKTKPTVKPWLVRPPSSTTGVIMKTGSGRETVNVMDPMFSFGAARGGMGLEPLAVSGSTLSRAAMSGSHGMVVITW